MLGRKDLSIEGNTARRLFWEMCASREPVKNQEWELPEDVADWADLMLEEWDKRWIADSTPDDEVKALICPDCGEAQRKTPSGLVCINGHGY